MPYNDLRYAVRQYLRSPGITIVVTMSLACGIGANTAFFSAINTLLLKQLPVKGAQQLIQLDSVNTQKIDTLRGFSYPGFERLRKAGDSVLSGMFAYATADASSSVWPALANSSVIYQGNAAIAKGLLASASMYMVLGVQPFLGRLFLAEDDRVEGGSPVVVLSYRYWQARFGGDRAIIGKAIIVNQVPMTVIGVTPPTFRGVELGYAPDFTAPISMAAALKLESMRNGSEWWLAILARKKPVVSDRQVELALQLAFHQTVSDLIQASPALMTRDIRRMVSGLVLKVNPANQGAASVTRAEFRRSFAYLMAMVILLLGIVCVNVANLILARSAARSAEIRVRMSVGASGAQVFRQMLTEILLLAFAGCGLALPFAWWGGPLLLNVFTDESITDSLNFSPDWRVFAFTLAAATVCGICLGVVPVIQISKMRLYKAVNEGRINSGKAPNVLMVTQIALALLLAAGAGLLVRSFRNIRQIDPGFRPDQVLVFHVTPSSAGYSATREQQLYNELAERLQKQPESRFVSFSRFAPGESAMGTLVRVPGERLGSQPEPVSVNVVAPSYFKTVGIDFVRGRTFDARRQSVAIVNQSFVHHYFGEDDPLGKNFTLLGTEKTPVQIVGVVKDVKEHGLLTPVPRMIYFPYGEGSGDAMFFVRTLGNPLALIPAIRQELKRLDPLVPLSDIGTLNLRLERSVSREYVLAILSSAMGVLALALASIGLYGVIAYSVSRETKSIGIRMALGAEASVILWSVLRRVLLLLSSGLGIGLVCVLVLSRYLRSLLYGLAPNDLANIALSAAILIAASFIAAYFPARRAARIDPAIALRDD